MKSKIVLADGISYGPHSYNYRRSYIRYHFEGELGEYVKYYEDTPEAAKELLYDAARMYAFGDCSDEIIDEIVIQGWKVEYVGWQPDMLFEFYDTHTGEVIWGRSFPHWNH